MLVTGSIEEIRSTVKLWKREKLTVGFVPTMGALHDGHLELIRKAKSEADRVVVSIFVNPKQFGPSEDYNEYPRMQKEDLRACRKLRVASVFAPTVSEMYPASSRFSISLNQLNRHMCGASRPGFFEGVVVVVNKLFNIVQPDLAVFGQKDIQQFRILETMVQEFNHDVELKMGEIVRAADGLALSSRNAYLTNDERLKAPLLYRTLQQIETEIDNGVTELSDQIRQRREELEANGLQIDYLDIYAYDTLEPVSRLEKGCNYILAGAVYIGSTRLIDNIIIDL